MVSFLFYLYDQTGSTEYREAGLRAAQFLVRTAWDSDLGVFPFEHVEPSAAPSGPAALAYFFDSGIIVRGLLSAWRETKRSEFLEIALRAGRGMLSYFRGTTAIHPILTLPGRTPRAYESRWSAGPGCYQLKAAMAWYDLWKVSGEEEMLAAYESVVEQGLATEHDFLRCEPDSAKLMDRLHAYAYFLEGLLPSADHHACARALADGIPKLAHHLNSIAPCFARSDVYAQLLRIRLFADKLGVASLNAVAAASEAEAAATFQIESSDVRTKGGFGFGTRQGEMLPFVNPVSTAFCVQALTFWEQHLEHAFKANHEDLV
jgi:hypothetical protein